MSDYAYVAEHARKIFASVSRLENELEKNPESWSVRRNLRSMQKLAVQARAELERLAALNKIEVCDYRIVPDVGWRYGLEHIARSFLQYQLLFSQIYDSFKNGKKDRARIGSEASEESGLDFGYSYAGSLGVVLLCRSERDFFEGNLDKPIEALYQVLDIDDAHAVRDVAHELGRAVVKRLHDWSDAHVVGGFSADVHWQRSDGRLLAQMVDRQKMERLVNVIDSAADEETEVVSVRGVLVAVSLPARSFHLAVPDGESFRGHFSKDFVQPDQMTVGRIYDARIEISDTYYYATEEHKKSNSLLSLSGPLRVEDSGD